MKQYMMKASILSIATIAALGMSGCGGGGSSSGSTTSTTQTGTFADAPVKGLAYKTPTQSGFTDASGHFKYVAGENVEFKLGNLTLGNGKAGAFVTPYTISENNTTATNIALVLQNFDGNRSNTGVLDLSKLKDYNFTADDVNLSADSTAVKNTISDMLVTAGFAQYRDDSNNTVIDAKVAKAAMDNYIKTNAISDKTIAISGKVITISDANNSQTNTTAIFATDGSYSENGYDGTTPYSCSGKWKLLSSHELAMTCKDQGTTAIPTESDFVVDVKADTIAQGTPLTIYPDGKANTSTPEYATIASVASVSTSDTYNTLFPEGTVAFQYDTEVPNYATINFGSSNSMTMTEYDFNGSNFNLGEVDNLTFTIQSDTNASFVMQNGEEGNVILNSVISTPNIYGSSIPGMKLITQTFYVTKSATNPTWSPAGWTPTNSNGAITNITTLKNQYITNNWWEGDDNSKYMFEDTNDTSLTSGNLVEAITSTQQNCTPTAGNDCKIYTRTNNVIGTWNLTNSVLTFDTNNSINSFRFDSNGTFEAAWGDKAGSSFSMQWYTGGTDSSVNSSIESAMRGYLSK